MAGQPRMADKELLSRLRRFIYGQERKGLDTQDLQSVAAGESYPGFCKAIGHLQDQGVIEPIRASGKNGRNPALYNRYRRLDAPGPDSELLADIRRLPFNAGVEHYLRHPDQFEEDRWYIQAIGSFLRQGNKADVSVNERSYQLFRDEKSLAEGRGRQVLRRLGLSLADLRVFKAHEPFAYFDLRPTGANPALAMIVENLDTFTSFHRHLRSGGRCPRS